MNEQDLPQFVNGPYSPIGQVRGVPVAPKKQASGLLKRIMSHAKPAGKMKGKGKSSGRGKKRGIEADSKVHFGKLHRYY